MSSVDPVALSVVGLLHQFEFADRSAASPCVVNNELSDRASRPHRSSRTPNRITAPPAFRELTYSIQFPKHSDDWCAVKQLDGDRRSREASSSTWPRCGASRHHKLSARTSAWRLVEIWVRVETFSPPKTDYRGHRADATRAEFRQPRPPDDTVVRERCLEKFPL